LAIDFSFESGAMESSLKAYWFPDIYFLGHECKRL